MEGQQQNNSQDNNAQSGAGGMGGTMGGAQAQAHEAMHGLEAWLAPIFEKFPHLPAGGRDWIVGVAPYIVLVFGILGLIGLLGAGGLGMIASILTMGMGLPMMLSIIISLVSVVLMLMAFPGLKAHTKKGWNLVFYSQLVSIVGGIVGAFTMMYASNLVGTAVGALIGFYILFEIRSYYK